MKPEWKLTPRQWEVLDLMSKGFTNPEIADLLKVALGTVKAHVGAIIAELDVTNRTEAALLYQEGLESTPSPNTSKETDAPAGLTKLGLVVLPFSDHSPSQEHQYFADGLAEELMCTLGRYTGFRIIARSTAFALRGRNLSTSEIGRQLNVWGMLEGSIAITGDDVRINVQLVEAESEYMLWSEIYRSKLSDVLQLQQQITTQVVKSLSHLTTTERESPPPAHLPTFDVYQAYLEGRAAWHLRTPEGVMRAIGCFQKAVDADPNYAQAYTGLADAYNQIAIYSPMPPKGLFELSEQFLQRALTLEPNLSEALAAQGYVDTHYHRNFARAKQNLDKAIINNPSYTYGYGWSSLLNIILGDFEQAIEYAKQGQALDILSPSYRGHFANIDRYLGRVDEALAGYRAAISSEPKDVRSLIFFAYTLAENNEYDEAKKVAEEFKNTFPNQPMAEAAYGHVLGLCGERDSTQAIFDKLKTQQSSSYVPSHAFVLLNLGLGETDAAVEQLKLSISERNSMVLYLKVEPMFEPVRQHSEFPVLLNALGVN